MRCFVLNYLLVNTFAMNFFTKWFKKSATQANIHIMNKYLIVGLGNIGAEYVNTRHNIGFKAVDFMANEANATFETVKLGSLTQIKVKNKVLFLLKPNTYMNLSGKAVQYWMDKEKIPKENILIITDDLNLPFGSIRIKAKGSDGGHNGLKNIQLVLNGSEYSRLRFGISDAFKKGQQVDYVLGEWSDEEITALKERLQVVSAATKEFALAGLNNAMNNYNGK